MWSIDTYPGQFYILRHLHELRTMVNMALIFCTYASEEVQTETSSQTGSKSWHLGQDINHLPLGIRTLKVLTLFFGTCYRFPSWNFNEILKGNSKCRRIYGTRRNSMIAGLFDKLGRFRDQNDCCTVSKHPQCATHHFLVIPLTQYDNTLFHIY